MNPGELLMNAAWEQVLIQVSPFTRVVSLGCSIVHGMDHDDRSHLIMNFAKYVGLDSMIVQDGLNLDRFFLGPIADFSSENRTFESLPGYYFPILMPQYPTAMKKCEVINAEARSPSTSQELSDSPSSTFSDSSKENQRLNAVPKNKKKTRDIRKNHIPRPPNAYILYRQDRHQALKNKNPSISNNEISRILGRSWKEEECSVRLHYKEKADLFKKEFLEDHPNYQYRPRRAGEKKRRAKRTSTSTVSSTDDTPQGSFLGSCEDCDSYQKEDVETFMFDDFVPTF
uniref:Putative mating type 1-2-1 protein n=1 Tax=Knoxdaviesia capensis TaxID=114771 RepID=A0A1J0CYG4_9PEZI|nr:putative mating type 1-2-1 protein [Knoxdaviesia capensis]